MSEWPKLTVFGECAFGFPPVRAVLMNWPYNDKPEVVRLAAESPLGNALDLPREEALKLRDALTRYLEATK